MKTAAVLSEDWNLFEHGKLHHISGIFSRFSEDSWNPSNWISKNFPNKINLRQLCLPSTLRLRFIVKHISYIEQTKSKQITSLKSIIAVCRVWPFILHLVSNSPCRSHLHLNKYSQSSQSVGCAGVGKLAFYIRIKRQTIYSSCSKWFGNNLRDLQQKDQELSIIV